VNNKNRIILEYFNLKTIIVGQFQQVPEDSQVLLKHPEQFILIFNSTLS
jgi:hypothetical protein